MRGVRVLAALAPATLLAADPWGWYPFGPIKWAVVLVLSLAGAALVLHEQPARVPRPLGWALGALLAWLAVAAAVGEDPLYAWTGTPERHLGVLTWALCALLLCVGTALGERQAAVVLRGLLVAGFGVGAVATAEALGWEPSLLTVAPRLSGPVGSPAYLGAAAALLLPIALAATLRPLPTTSGPPAPPQDANPGAKPSVPDGFRPPIRVLGGLAGGGLGVAVVGSGARAAWVGLVAAGLVALVARWAGVVAAVRARPRLAALGSVAALAAAVVLAVATPVGGRLADLTDPDAAGGAGRLDEWRVAARVVVDHPLTGVGPEGYRIAFHDGVDDAYEREHGRVQQPDRAHSSPLDVALAGGVPLLLAWAAVLAVVARAAWRALRTGAPWQQGIAAALVAHWVGQLLLFPIVELEPIAWLLAGVLVASTTPRPAPTPDPTVSGPVSWVQGLMRPGQNSWGGGARGWVATGLGVLAVLGAVAGATDVVADHRADDAVAALARGDGRAAARAADAAAALRPDVVRLHLLAARAAVADGQGALGGLHRVDDALAVSPGDPIARRERLRLLVQRAESTQTRPHLAEARKELDRALAADGSSAALWALDARLARVEGHPERARRSEARADELTPPEELR